MIISRDASDEVIGTATMRNDRTIILELDFTNRSAGPTGKSTLTFVPGDEAYRVVLRHLPRLKPGDIQVVRNDWEA